MKIIPESRLQELKRELSMRYNNCSGVDKLYAGAKLIQVQQLLDECVDYYSVDPVDQNNNG